MSKVSDAYKRCKAGRNALAEAGAQSMETTEDKCGIVWERWLLPNCTSVVLYATPHGWDVFAPLTADNSVDATVAAIKTAAPAERIAE